MKISGIKSKLLLAFITVLVIITGLNVGLASYLTTQQSEREAFTSLTRQTVLLQNELQETIVDLRAIAEKNIAGIDNLSDLSTLYAKTQQLTAYPEQAAENERGLLFNKIISLNRLQVILQTADFSSAAVYVDNELSHYLTTTEAGMSAIRGDYRPLLKTGQNQAGELEFDNWPNWAEGTPSPLVTPHITPVNRPTISFDFTAEQMVVLQIVVPVQAITRTVMRENITLGSPEGLLVDDLAIATPETLGRSIPGQNKPAIIGAFVFRKVFDQAFLEDIAEKTGLLPALYSLDGKHQLQLVDLKMAPADLAQWARENQAAIDRQMRQRTLAVDQESYYQTLALWQFEEEPQLIIGFAQSAASTSQKVRETVTGLVGIAGLVLLVGGTLGYLLFDRLVKPIRILTAAVSRIGPSVQQESPDRPVTPIASDKLVEIDLRASDEVGQLTTAFNAMVRQLRQSFETLEQRVVERTEELQIAKDAAEAARRLAEAANQAKSVFLANMSHELRTPLNAVLGYADILKRRTGYTGPLADGLDIIQRSGEHLLTLINDVLDLAKVEAGKLELNPAPFHLPTFLREIIDIIRARAEAKDLSLTYEALSPLPDAVLADEKRLRQVLLNLLGNAVKFTDAGHVALRVTAKDEIKKMKDEEGGAGFHPSSFILLTFEVEDSGPGIPSDQLERIFQPFEQVSEAGRQAEGAGLGLAISQQIVQLMGSRLQVESPPSVPPTGGEVKGGAGSTFWFEVALPATEVAPREQPVPVRNIVGYEGARRRVLVADDKLYNRMLLADMLTPLGFEVSVAEDGQQAVNKALALRPHAIVIDLVMPVKTGVEAAQEIRQRPEMEGTVIIAVSASVMEVDREKSRVAGCNAFLPKPVKLDRLLDLLAAHLKLTWVYAEPEEPAAGAEPLLPPPPETLAALHELARMGEILEIQKQALRLEEMGAAYIPFARKLQELAKGFEIEQINAFVKQFIEEKQDEYD
jgi:signal transduction histidine kinase/ActR/RegA family two-component response regulator